MDFWLYFQEDEGKILSINHSFDQNSGKHKYHNRPIPTRFDGITTFLVVMK